jgi:DNA-binding response OmpR family regulator
MAARILAVEANREVRSLMNDILTAEGYEVTCIIHGAETLVLLEQGPAVDLILSDLALPATEGAQLYRQLGNRWPARTPRVICVTDGYGAGAIDHPTLRAASARFVVKPFLPDQLLDVVSHTLARDGRP